MTLNKYHINDLYIGLTASFSIVVTEGFIRSFSTLTGDFHSLHIDKSYAMKHGFADVVAHGVLITSISSRLIGMELPGLQSIVLAQKSEYYNPVFPGDELTFTGVISKIRKSLSIVFVGIEVINQKGENISFIEFTVKIRES